MKQRAGYRWVSILCGILLGAGSIGIGEAAAQEKQNICTITIENVTRGEEYPDTEKVEEAVNAITVPAIQCRVKIENCSIRDHASRINTMTAERGQIDLINTGLTVSLSELAANGKIIPLDALLQEHGRELMEKAGNLLSATMVNGSIYAVPANLYASKAMGIGYNKTIAEKFGIPLHEGMAMEELEAAGMILKEQGIYLTSQGNGELTAFPAYYDLEAFGGDLNYGVIFEPVENMEIVNAYESSQYREYCETIKRWRKQGYIPTDSIFGGENGEKLFYNEKAFYQWSSVSPASERIIRGKHLDFEQVLLALTENVLSTESVVESTWGITASCENPEKAMEFLNLLYTDAEVANLLQNGLEVQEYEKVSENVIRYADESGLGYGTSFSFFGDGCQLYYFEPATENFHEELKAFDRQARISLTMGYLFDPSGLSPEIAAVSSVVSEYRPILETGMADDVQEFLDEFNFALKQAGIDRIIEENRRQLDIWKRREGSAKGSCTESGGDLE